MKTNTFIESATMSVLSASYTKRSNTFFRFVLAFLLLVALSFGSGCASYQSTAGKMLASTVVTVDSAMKSWAVWVKYHGTTLEQELVVKGAYIKYQKAIELAKVAYADMAVNGDKTEWEKVRAEVQSTVALIVGLIDTFKKGNTP